MVLESYIGAAAATSAPAMPAELLASASAVIAGTVSAAPRDAGVAPPIVCVSRMRSGGLGTAGTCTGGAFAARGVLHFG